jgi:hypothetical protein
VNVFVKTAAQYWWTSDMQMNDTNKIWCTNSGGGAGNHPKTETSSAGGTKKFHVRAVRDVVTPVSITRYTLLSPLMVQDENTGLTWSRSTYIDSITWEDALLYADSSKLGGFTDWRLPNIKEIQSLVDVGRINPALNTNFFNSTPAVKLWSSTTLFNKMASAWYMDTRYGITTYDAKVRKNYAMLVRGGLSGQVAVNQPIRLAPPVVYPLPFHDQFQLQGVLENTYCEMYNYMGCTLYKGPIGAIQAADFPAGVYWLKVQGFVRSIKLVKSDK